MFRTHYDEAEDAVRISADDDFSSIADRIGVGENEQLRTSSRRESYLQGFAQITTRRDLELLLHPSRSDTRYKDDGTPLVRIGSMEVPQPATSLPSKVFDLLCQEAVTIHEIGHVLYSDFDALERELETIDDDNQPLFMQIVNPLEDGAIESQLRGRYNVSSELYTLYSNVAPQGTHGTSTHDMTFADFDGVMFTFHEATVQYLYDACTYDTGVSSRLLDPDDDEYYFVSESDHDRTLFEDLQPEIEDLLVDYLSESSGDKRMAIASQFFRDVYLDYLDDAEVAGMDQARNKQAGSGGAGSRIGGDLDTSNPTHAVAVGGSQNIEDATRLPSSDEIRDRIDRSKANDTDAGSAVGDLSERYDDQSRNQDQSSDELQDSIRNEYEDEIRQEAADAAGGMLDELETIHGLLGGHEELNDLEVLVERRDEPDLDQWADVQQWGERLATILERRLRREHRSKTKTRQRAGSIDTRMMPQATRGYSRIFQHKDDPDIEDYSCLIVQDRSSSMSQVIGHSERAVGSFAYALDSCGVDVSVIDFIGGQPRLSLPFGSSVPDRRAELLSGDCGGGTPLAKVLSLGRNRVEQIDGNTFVIIVTDDCPSAPESYADQLDQCNFPVIGVSLCPDGDPGNVDHAEYFHRSKIVEDMNELLFHLEHLAEEVLL